MLRYIVSNRLQKVVRQLSIHQSFFKCQLELLNLLLIFPLPSYFAFNDWG